MSDAPPPPGHAPLADATVEWQVEFGDQGETFIVRDQALVRAMLVEWVAKVSAVWNPLRSQQFAIRIRRVVRATVVGTHEVRAPSEPIRHDDPLERT